MRLVYINTLLLLLCTFLLQPIVLAVGQPTDQFILPPDGQKDHAYHMVVIGDSIAWGNGLKNEGKYSYLVADWLQNKLNRPVDVAIYAHSGATISGESGESIDPNLNSGSPTLMDQAKNIQNKDDVDLILVSGGINDVGVLNIINAYMPAEKIDQQAQSIKDPMKNLLSLLQSECKNAKIVVTNYYPIVSDDSDVKLIAPLYSTAIFAINTVLNEDVLDALTLQERLTENSYMFSSGSLIALTKAVREANNDAKRITLAMVNFQPKNSYAASDTWLWALVSLVPLKTDDDQFDYRSSLTSDPINKINAIGHPNRDGAREYARAIESAIESWGPNWLQDSKPNDAEAWNNKGDYLGGQGKYDEAIKAYDEAIKLDPQLAVAWSSKSAALTSLGRYEEGLQASDKAIELKPDLAVAWNNKGYALSGQGKYDEAIAVFDEAIQLDPNFALAWSNRAGSLVSLGRNDEALLASERAIQLDPKLALAWGNKGLALNYQGKYDEAIAVFDEAIQLDPNFALAWSNKGLALNFQGKYDEAIQAYDMAIQLNPQLAEAWSNKGFALDDQGKYDEAIQAYDTAIQLNPQLSEAWYNKGLALNCQGKYDEAEAAFARAEELGYKE